MFKAKRNELLNKCRWEPSSERNSLGYIEAWWAADEGVSFLNNTLFENDKLTEHGLVNPDEKLLRTGRLTDDEVDDWIHQRRQFAAPCYSSSSDRSLSGRLRCIRLLMCERSIMGNSNFYPPTFAMSQRSFIQVERSFGLPQATLPLISRSTGMEYCRLEFTGQERQPSPSICKFILRIPVKHNEADFQKLS
jgi:hypothetical protein